MVVKSVQWGIQWLRGYNFALFWPPATSTWTFLTLNVDKNTSSCPRSHWMSPYVYVIFIGYSLPGNENAKKEGYGREGSEYNRKVCLMDELIISRNRKYDGIIWWSWLVRHVEINLDMPRIPKMTEIRSSPKRVRVETCKRHEYYNTMGWHYFWILNLLHL